MHQEGSNRAPLLEKVVTADLDDDSEAGSFANSNVVAADPRPGDEQSQTKRPPSGKKNISKLRNSVIGSSGLSRSTWLTASEEERLDRLAKVEMFKTMEGLNCKSMRVLAQVDPTLRCE